MKSPAVQHALIAFQSAIAANNLDGLSGPQLACIIDERRHTEAFYMLEDLLHRVWPQHPHLRPYMHALMRAMTLRFGDPLPHYLKEFPSYGPLGFEIPSGFEDVSWHNDVCPSIEGHSYRLFCDYERPEYREMHEEGRTRYGLCLADDGHLPYVLNADTWCEVGPFIASTLSYNGVQRIFLGERITRAKAEILAHVAYQTPRTTDSRPIPLDLRGFAELHDYCDANCIADMCEPQIVQQFEQVFGKANVHDAVRIVQTTLNQWITCGSMKKQALAVSSNRG